MSIATEWYRLKAERTGRGRDKVSARIWPIGKKAKKWRTNEKIAEKAACTPLAGGTP
jgi:hypothetical protein